jgi:hypothetical protein
MERGGGVGNAVAERGGVLGGYTLVGVQRGLPGSALV